MDKKLLHFFFFSLLLLFVGCSDGESPAHSDPDHQETVLAEPVDTVAPDVLFADVDLIKEGNASTVIMDRLIELIDAVPEDASIYISIYLFEYEPLLESLKRAHSRNVSLHVMMDMSYRSDNENTADELAALDDDVEIVSVYNNASSSAINHNKFVLLPEVSTSEGIAKNVVFQTSQNFDEVGNTKIQDAVILSDQGLYNAYLDYWMDMKSLANVQMADFSYREYEEAEAGIMAYFLPKRKNGTSYGEDTIIEILEDIENPSLASVKVAMSAWTDSRIEVLQKLKELLTEGAEVEVITKSNIGSEIYQGLENLAEGGATVRIYNLSNSGPAKVNLHSKFMLIEGIWNGKQAQVLVTGTQNFTVNALRNNNETTLLLSNHQFYSEYNSYFQELKTLPALCCALDE